MTHGRGVDPDEGAVVAGFEVARTCSPRRGSFDHPYLPRSHREHVIDFNLYATRSLVARL